MEAVQRKLGCGRTPASGMRQREQRTCVASTSTRSPKQQSASSANGGRLCTDVHVVQSYLYLPAIAAREALAALCIIIIVTMMITSGRVMRHSATGARRCTLHIAEPFCMPVSFLESVPLSCAEDLIKSQCVLNCLVPHG